MKPFGTFKFCTEVTSNKYKSDASMCVGTNKLYLFDYKNNNNNKKNCYGEICFINYGLFVFFGRLLDTEC